MEKFRQGRKIKDERVLPNHYTELLMKKSENYVWKPVWMKCTKN
jgi:hypothetical protein